MKLRLKQFKLAGQTSLVCLRSDGGAIKFTKVGDVSEDLPKEVAEEMLVKFEGLLEAAEAEKSAAAPKNKSAKSPRKKAVKKEESK